jgi:hypothetical protein
VRAAKTGSEIKLLDGCRRETTEWEGREILLRSAQDKLRWSGLASGPE